MNARTIAVDAMGGDFGPQITVPACVQALLCFPLLKILLVGEQSEIKAQFDSLGLPMSSRITLIHAASSISDNLLPSHALRSSEGSSMRIALELVAQGKADACVSAGNTGALIALSRSLIKLLPGIDRPALVSALPTFGEHQTWLLDLGANVSVDENTLFQFALMGSVLAQEQLNRSPRVGLLNIGEEKIKGNNLVKRCSTILQQCNAINYIGYIEGDQIFTGKADVVVCDGFVGNICLKTSEGVAKLFLNDFKMQMSGNVFKKIIFKWLFKGLIKRLNNLNPDQYNGASLLGLRSTVIKSHGRADVRAFQFAIEEALYEVERQLPKKIDDHLDVALLERHH